MSARIFKYWIRAFVFAFGVCALCLMSAGTAFAQQGWDKRTMVTFDSPVEIPGISAQVLPAGTYVFRLADSAGNRHIVQIYNRDETHLYANILAIPNYRLRPTDKTVMTFSERKAGEPQAIRAWFYPGDNSGQEFVYPKKRAVELAKEANLPVLYIPEEIAPNIVAPAATPTAPPIIALREAPLVAVTPAGQDIALAEVVVPPPVQTASVLPKTASALPLVALMGLFCLLVGLWRQPLCVR
ncbi:MAG TPA: hypothetical protein VFR05_01670 [Terriglobia bacterium]|nr:hypothetical protein [Terriglobia bacterium]